MYILITGVDLSVSKYRKITILLKNISNKTFHRVQFLLYKKHIASGVLKYIKWLTVYT